MGEEYDRHYYYSVGNRGYDRDWKGEGSPPALPPEVHVEPVLFPPIRNPIKSDLFKAIEKALEEFNEKEVLKLLSEVHLDMVYREVNTVHVAPANADGGKFRDECCHLLLLYKACLLFTEAYEKGVWDSSWTMASIIRNCLLPMTHSHCIEYILCTEPYMNINPFMRQKLLTALIRRVDPLEKCPPQYEDPTITRLKKQEAEISQSLYSLYYKSKKSTPKRTTFFAEILDKSKLTPLFFAVCDGDINSVAKIVRERTADPNKTLEGKTPLHQACLQYNNEFPDESASNRIIKILAPVTSIENREFLLQQAGEKKSNRRWKKLITKSLSVDTNDSSPMCSP